MTARGWFLAITSSHASKYFQLYAPSEVFNHAQVTPESQRRTVPGCEMVLIHTPSVPHRLLKHWKLQLDGSMGLLPIGAAVLCAQEQMFIANTDIKHNEARTKDLRIAVPLLTRFESARVTREKVACARAPELLGRIWTLQ